ETLAPTIRQLPGIKGSNVVISDTVGFVRDLPHELVAAFRATLQEAVDADLLLHVIDDNNDEHREHIIEVNKVLQELKLNDVPMIEIYNKIDLSGSNAQTLAGDEGLTNKIWLSAQTQQGVDLLNKTIEERLNSTHLRMSFTLPLRYAQLRALFYQLDGIRSDEYIGSIGWQIEVELPLGKWLKLAKSDDANGHFLTQTLEKHNYCDESKTIDHTAIGEKYALE
ncbi:MAG: 50S ribosome-binding GTPase, partial [Proteobacteria bacterium]|nr:50S ribosome-binding GTPase [Pseudomonadota bacterium]